MMAVCRFPRAGRFGLRAEVERTGERHASTRSHLGVSVRSALGTSACTRRQSHRSMQPDALKNRLRRRKSRQETGRQGLYYSLKTGAQASPVT